MCPVCLEVFKHPQLLFCSHTICKQCIAGIVDSGGDAATGPGDAATGPGDCDNRHGDIICPVCRARTKPALIGELPRNRALEEAVEHWREKASSNRLHWLQTSISSCSEHQRRCDTWCHDCEMLLCDTCLSRFDHDSHEYVSMPDFDEYCSQKARVAGAWLDVQARARALQIQADCLTGRQAEVNDCHRRWLGEITSLQRDAHDAVRKKFTELRADVNWRYARALKPLTQAADDTRAINARVHEYLDDVCGLFDAQGMPQCVPMPIVGETLVNDADDILSSVDLASTSDSGQAVKSILGDGTNKLDGFLHSLKDYSIVDKYVACSSASRCVRRVVSSLDVVIDFRRRRIDRNANASGDATRNVLENGLDIQFVVPRWHRR